MLESGRTGMLFVRMDLAMFRAVIDESGRQSLPSVVHTGSARDVEDAVDAGAIGIEHASFTERISSVVLKGERVRRIDLFDAAKNPLQ